MQINKIINSIVLLLDKFQDIKNNAKKEVIIEFNRLKRKLAIKIFQIFFYCLAISLILASIIIFFSRLFALDAVLFATGLILIYISFLLKFYYK